MKNKKHWIDSNYKMLYTIVQKLSYDKKKWNKDELVSEAYIFVKSVLPDEDSPYFQKEKAKYSSFVYTCVQRFLWNLIKKNTSEIKELELNDENLLMDDDMGLDFFAYEVKKVLKSDELEKILNYRLNGMTLHEIGRKMGCSHEKIHLKLIEIQEICIKNNLF